MKVNSKASKNLQQLKQQNVLLTLTIDVRWLDNDCLTSAQLLVDPQKLKETLTQAVFEKSELSSALERFRAQQEQERGQLLVEIRNLEVDVLHVLYIIPVLNLPFQKNSVN